MKGQRRVFSESFKRGKVRLYESGKMTVSQMSRFYEISETALYKWISKYRTTPITQRIVVEDESDYLELLAAQKRIEKMERLIGNQQLTIAYQQAILEAASAHYEEDVEKKFS